MPEFDSTSHSPAFNTDHSLQRMGNDYYTYGSNYWFCHKCQTWICGNNYHACSLNYSTGPSDNQKIIQLLERIVNMLNKIELTQSQDSHTGKHKRG